MSTPAKFVVSGALRPRIASRMRGAVVVAVAVTSTLSACHSPRSSAEGSAALTAPLPPISQFAILATRLVSVADRGVVTGGSVGVTGMAGGALGSVVVGFDARVAAGKVLLAHAVTLRDRAVTGQIGANSRNIAASAVTGPRSAFVAPPTPPAPGPFTAGNNNITVAIGQNRSLGPGRFGTVTVNGSLSLSGGLYEIHSLHLGPDARVTAMAAATVRMVTGLVAADRARVTASPALRAEDLKLLAAGAIDAAGNSVTWGTDGRLTAILAARNNFRAGARLQAVGAIAARDVVVGNDAHIAFSGGFGCGTADQCDDGNACTGEACVDTRCSVTNLPGGTACDDLDACTRNSQCQAGRCVGGALVTCPVPDQCHTQGTCDPATGTCTNLARPDGTTCDDADVCTNGETCQTGACGGGIPMVTEFPTGLVQPRSIVSGPDGSLWFVSPEVMPGQANGSVGKLAPATGAVTAFPTDKRLNDIAAAGDGHLWLAEQLPASDFGLAALGRITTAGLFLPSLVGLPAQRVTGGADGKVWFTSASDGLHLVGAVRTDVELLTNLLVVGNAPRAICSGPDGNMWIAASNGGAEPARIGRITSTDVLTEFPVASTGDLNGIVTGPDGQLWFTDAGQNQIGRIAPDGSALTKFNVPTAASGLQGIAVGPDGNLWFTEEVANRIGRITPAGQITEFACIPTAASGPTSIVAGPDDSLWLTQSAAGTVARVRLP